MNTKQAKEMTEALLTDNETSLTALGSYGDEVAVALLMHCTALEDLLLMCAKDTFSASGKIKKATAIGICNYVNGNNIDI